MPIVLEPPLTRSGWASHLPPDEPMQEAPRYMRTKAMSRWHRTRSGIRHGLDGHVSFHFWCGAFVGESKLIGTDDRPDDLPVCGTCEGRAVGAGQDEWNLPGPGLLFEPRRLTPPARCPGSRKERLYQQLYNETGRNLVRCLVCEEIVPGRGYGWRFGSVIHPPGPGLVAGCPFHAWSYLTVLPDGRVACACTDRTPR